MQKTPRLHPRTPVTTVFAAMALACSVPSVHAASVAWDGDIDASWANDLNWAGGAAPADNINDDIAVFSGTTAYTFQPTLDAFTVRSVNGLTLGGPSAVALTIGADTGTRLSSGTTTAGSTVITMADVTGVTVGQHVTGTRIPAGTFVIAVDTDNNTITLSAPTSGGSLADATTLTFRSALRVGGGGITMLNGTPSSNQVITAPLVLAANQVWNNEATSPGRTLQVQGSIYLDSHTLTLEGGSGSTIRFNGQQGGDSGLRQSISGTGNIVIDTLGTVIFGADEGNRMVNTFTGGVTLNNGTLTLHGGNGGGSGNVAGHLGTGVLTINGGRITGSGNIATHPLSISGQVWNADWEFGGGKHVDMGTGDINLGTAAGTSRTLTVSSGSFNLTLGGGISDGTTANTFIKAGISTLILNGANTLTGDTIIQEGTLTFGETGSITIYIGENGVNNQLSGDGILNFDGTLIFDFSLADATEGNAWAIIDSALLENTSFAATFGVQGFSGDAEDGIWTFGDYTFTQSTGLLTYGAAIPEPSAAAVFAGLGVLGLVATRRRRA